MGVGVVTWALLPQAWLMTIKVIMIIHPYLVTLRFICILLQKQALSLKIHKLQPVEVKVYHKMIVYPCCFRMD